MRHVILRRSVISLTLGLVTLATLAGCSGDDPKPDTAGPAAETATATGEPGTATSRAEQPGEGTSTTNDGQTESSAGDTAQAAGGDESRASALTLDRDTSWQDVFETLTASEQACIRDLGDEVPALLGRKVLRDDATEAWEADFFSCLDPETGRQLLLSSMLVGMEEEGMEVGEAETACLREVLAEIDPATFVAASEDEGPEVNAFVGGVWRCLPDLFFESIAAEIGINLGAVTEAELACVHEWVRELDMVALLDAIAEGDEAVPIGLVFGLYRCSPSLLLASFGDIEAELDAEAEACLRELLDGAEASELADEGILGSERFYTGLVICVPALSEFTDETSDGSDDHADFFDGATVIAVGVEAPGELGSYDDSDYFVFEAEQGVLYEINIGLVTLGDSVLTLYDGEWRELAFSDDYSDTLASRVYWLAEYSGDHYIEVWGYDLGAYTVLVEER